MIVRIVKQACLRWGSDKLAVLERLLNFDKLPGFVDKIKVVELNIGKNYPAFRNCKIVKRKSQSVAAAAEAAAAVAAMTGHPIGLGDEEAVAGSDYSDNEAESLLARRGILYTGAGVATIGGILHAPQPRGHFQPHLPHHPQPPTFLKCRWTWS